MNGTISTRTWALVLGALATWGLLAAQPAQAVTSTEQIDRLEAIYGALLDYRPGAPPIAQPFGTFGVGLELLPVPPIDNRIGAKREYVNPPPAIPRVRADAALGAGFSLGVAWIPALQVQGYVADMLGVAVDYGAEWGPLRIGVRGFTQYGSVHGPVTAPHSDDRFTLASQGADARVGWAWREWIVYAGTGSGANHTELDVQSDGSQNPFSHAYHYAFAGLSGGFGPWRLTVEQQATETYLQNLVLTVRHAF